MIKRFIHTHDHPVKSMRPSQVAVRDKYLQKVKSGEYTLENVDACICGNRQFNPLAERERYGLPMKTVICSNCGILLQSPRLSYRSLADFYRVHYRDFYMPDSSPKGVFDSQVLSGQGILSYLTQSGIQLPEKARVLDAGCGPGGMLKAFADQGYECVGCDYTDQQTQYGRSKGLNLFSGGIEEITPKYANYFDLVMLNDVLEHLLNPGAILFEIRKILKSDGYVYIQFPGTRDIDNSKYPDLLRLLQLAHTYYFDLKQLEYLLALQNFSLIKGDESLRAVFQKNTGVDPDRKNILEGELQGYSEDILQYIEDCEDRRLFLFCKNNFDILFKQPKAFLGQMIFFLRHSIFH